MTSKSFDIDRACAEQRVLDAQRLEAEWAELVNEAGGGERGEAIADALKQLYSLYTPSVCEWFAGLYDSEEGGFYATASGHDTEGFGPDVEATMQTLNFIRQSGLIRDVGTLEEALPQWLKEAMLRFAKSRQGADGYFYHPQWTHDDIYNNISRRGRDLGWALSIISTCGGMPTYDTPNGKKGDGLDADGRPVNCQARACEDDPTPPPKAQLPEYLENKESFLRYLATFDVKNRSYHYGNQLNATAGQIKARSKALIEAGADYSLTDILINWLNERIDPVTGYWSPVVNMEGTNGFFKIIAVYNSLGYVYPTPEQATVSVIHNILGDEVDDGNCCSLYNLWSGIVFIKKNVQLNPDEALREKVLSTIDETLRQRGAEAILNTYKKLIPYRRPNGSFSHSYEGCGGAQQGLITGLTPLYGVNEGCVDGTCICTTGLTRTLFEAFGFKRVSLFTKADWMKFIYTIEHSGKVKKTRVQDPLVTFTDKALPRTVTPTGDYEVSAGALRMHLGSESGLVVYPTARFPRGEFFLFECELDLGEVHGDGIRLSINWPRERILAYVDITERDGQLIIENHKWEVGFTASISHKTRLRLELYLDDTMERLDGWHKKSTAMRVYADGAYLGKMINNDGTDPSFPSPSSLNNTYSATLAAISGGECDVTISELRFCYAMDERGLGEI